jgi:hypothetical protein
MIGPAPGCAPIRALADLGLLAGKQKAGLVAARALLGRRAAGICVAWLLACCDMLNTFNSLAASLELPNTLSAPRFA